MDWFNFGSKKTIQEINRLTNENSVCLTNDILCVCVTVCVSSCLLVELYQN